MAPAMRARSRSRSERRLASSACKPEDELARRDAEKAMQFASSTLGIKQADLARIRNHKVVAVLKRLGGLWSSLSSFESFSEHMTPELQRAPLVANANIDKDLIDKGLIDDGETLSSFAQKLCVRTKAFATDFMWAFNEMVSFYKLDELRSINIMLADQPPDEPLEEEELSQILDVKSLNKAAEILVGEHDEWMACSRLFYTNVFTICYKTKLGTERMEQLAQIERQLKDLHTEHSVMVVAVAEAQGHLAAADNRLKDLHRLKEGMQSYVNWAVMERDRCDSELQKLEKRLHDYTYRMYGRFTYMWENDVALAKNKIAEYQRRKSELARSIEETKTKSVKDFTEEAQHLLKRIASLKTTLEQNDRPKLKRLQGLLEEKQKELNALKSKFDKMLEESGAVNVKHLRQIEEVTKAFAKSQSAAVEDQQILKGSLHKQIQVIVVNMNRLMKAKTALAQKKRLETVLKLIMQKDDECAIFFRKCLPVSNAASFNWELADLERVTAAPLHIDLPALPAPVSLTAPATLQVAAASLQANAVPHVNQQIAGVGAVPMPESDDDVS